MHDALRRIRIACYWAIGSLVLYVAFVLGAAYAPGALSFATALRALVGALIGGGGVALAAVLLRRRRSGLPPNGHPGAQLSTMDAEIAADETLRRQWLWSGFIWALSSLMFFASNTLRAAHRNGSVFFAHVLEHLWMDLVMGAFAGFISFVLARHRRRTPHQPGANPTRK